MNRFITLFLVLLVGLRAAQATTHEALIGRKGSLRAPSSLSGVHVGAAVKPAGAASMRPTTADAAPAGRTPLVLGLGGKSQLATLAPAGAYPTRASLASAGSYAGLVAFTTGQTPAPAFSLYPNPARGQTTVQVSGPGGADYALRLSNVLGSEVRRLLVRPDNAATDGGTALDLSSLPPGLYFCSLLVNEKTLVTKRLTVL